MKPPTTRALTPARIVALVLIGLTIAGLAYLRFAPDDRVSVPKGAQAGDLVLEPCTYATEDGGYDADCGTLVVSENPADPQSRLIALPVTRIRALSQHPKEPVFRLEGGPGITNMQFSKASRYAADRDVVLVGYRGVDGSVRLDCPEVDSAMKHSTDFLGEKSFRAYEAGFRACAARLTEEGFDLTRYGLAQQVDDMEAARKALGYDRIDLLSESAGTRTALIYAWRLPEAHPPLGDDRREPARALPLGSEDDRRAARPLRGSLREGRELSHADRRPRRLDAADGREHARPLALPADRGERAFGSSRSTGSWRRRRRWRR